MKTHKVTVYESLSRDQKMVVVYDIFNGVVATIRHEKRKGAVIEGDIAFKAIGGDEFTSTIVFKVEEHHTVWTPGEYRAFKASSWAEAYDEVDGFGLEMPEFKSFVYKHLPKSGRFFDQMKDFKEGEVVYL